jgi:hypothetical protein
MGHHRLTRSVVIATALGALAMPAPAPAAADQAARALHLRSQALNDRYAGADTTVPAERALRLRSQALNDRYATAEAPSVAVPVAAPSRDGIDWTDAGIGAGVMLVALSLTSLSAYLVVQRRRTDPARRRPATVA